jgi:hypothetical protein
MLAIEWKMFGGNELRRCYLGWMGYLDAVKKGEKGEILGGFFRTDGNNERKMLIMMALRL